MHSINTLLRAHRAGTPMDLSPMEVADLAVEVMELMPKHASVAALLEFNPMQQRINAMEAENQRLAALLREIKPLKDAP